MAARPRTARRPISPPLTLALAQASAWANQALLERLRGAGWDGLTLAQAHVLTVLAEEGPQRPAALARRLEVTRQSVQKLLENMAAADLVAVEPDPADRRATVVRPTAAGKAALSEARRQSGAVERELARRIGAPAVDQLKAVLGLDWGARPRSA